MFTSICELMILLDDLLTLTHLRHIYKRTQTPAKLSGRIIYLSRVGKVRERVKAGEGRGSVFGGIRRIKLPLQGHLTACCEGAGHTCLKG